MYIRNVYSKPDVSSCFWQRAVLRAAHIKIKISGVLRCNFYNTHVQPINVTAGRTAQTGGSRVGHPCSKPDITRIIKIPQGRIFRNEK